MKIIEKTDEKWQPGDIIKVWDECDDGKNYYMIVKMIDEEKYGVVALKSEYLMPGVISDNGTTSVHTYYDTFDNLKAGVKANWDHVKKVDLEAREV